MRRRLAKLAAALLVCQGCAKHEPAPRRTAPWLASAAASASAAPPASNAKRSFRIDAASSRIQFSLPGRKAKPSGSVPVLGGKLELAPSELDSARASVEADLLGISIDPASLPEDAGLTLAPNLLALHWLELGPGVSSEKREQFARARFELSSLEALSAPALDFGSQRPAKVRATAVGSLLLHGFRAPVRVELVLQPLPTAPGAPLRLSIRTASPLVLSLPPHDIGPRSAEGIAAPGEATRAEASLGKNAKIDVELVAEALPQNQ